MTNDTYDSETKARSRAIELSRGGHTLFVVHSKADGTVRGHRKVGSA